MSKSPSLPIRFQERVKFFVLFFSLISFFQPEIKAQQISSKTENSVRTLHQNWEFKQVGRIENFREAKVPGNLHADLLRHKLIADPYLEQNETSIQWVEKVDWEYRTQFQASSSELAFSEHELVFEGLDTYADVYLNDSLLLKANNMFRTWRANPKKLLKVGNNIIRIYFHSPVNKAAAAHAKQRPFIPSQNEQADYYLRNSVQTRKAPFHYGWDWGPRIVTSGIWRPVKWLRYNQVALENVYFRPQQVEAKQATASVELTLKVAKAGNYKLEASTLGGPTISLTASLNAGEQKVKLPLKFSSPKLWWPLGHGAQNTYPLTVNVSDAGGKLIAQKKQTIGLRKVEVIQDPDLDGKGRSFYFRINGKPIFAKGSNYIPSDNFQDRVDSAKYRAVIDAAVDANMNMLRVWGGAIYEEDYFYDYCTQKGVMVWQDFMFSCSMFPETEEFLSNIRAEAVENVQRLRNQACLVLWCGNNEISHGIKSWWKPRYKYSAEDSVWLERIYDKIFMQVLREVVQEHQPELYYWPQSPQSADGVLENRFSGDNHYWGVWFGRQRFQAYADNVGRFVSEYGQQSFPSMGVLRKITTPDQLKLGSSFLRHRQRSRYDYWRPEMTATETMSEYMGMYYNIPKKFEHHVYVSQLMHALGTKVAVESHRAAMPYCMGTLYWQIDDCWPTISWASLDYYLGWKAAHYAARESMQMLLPVFVPNKTNLSLKIVNDYSANQKVSATVRLFDMQGKVYWEKQGNLNVKGNAVTEWFTLPEKLLSEKGLQAENAVLHYQIQVGKQAPIENFHYYLDPKALNLPKTQVNKKITPVAGGFNIELRAPQFVKNLQLSTPDGEGHFSDNFFDMLPNRTYTVFLKRNKPFNTGSAEQNIELLHLAVVE